MNKDEVIRTLKEMGDLLEIAEANTFEIMAYRNAGRSLDEWEGDLAAAVEDGSLSSLRGTGKGLTSIISELVRSGRSGEHERIRGLVPEGLPELLTLSGIGPKKVRALWTELDVDSLAALEAAARAGRVSELRGFGKKTEERILASIERRKSGRKFAPSVRSKSSTVPAPLPASSGRLRPGTSGYSYKEWKGSFYPEDLAVGDFLSYYSTRFDTVEINNTFYRFPSEKALADWAAQTPDGFLFAVKANQRITHRSRLKNVEDVTASFVERCETLGERLGSILFQLPPTLKRDDALLADFVACLPSGIRYAIEFRHESWFDDATWACLSDGQVALVVHDDEKLSMPRLTTSEFAYVRLRRDGYDDADLTSWRTWFVELQKAKKDVFVYLKHDEGGESPEVTLGTLCGSDSESVRRHAPSTKKRRPAKRTQRRA